MMMLLDRCRTIVAFALIINAPALPSASAATLTSFRVNDWKGFAYSDDARQFDRCSATNKPSGGTSLTYSVDRQFHWSLRLSNAAWTFTKGAEVNLFLKIDDLESVKGRTVAIEKDTLEFLSGDPVRFFADLRVARELRAAMGGLFFQFPVVGSSEALSALTQCALRFSRFPIKGNAKAIEETSQDPQSRAKEADELAKLIVSYSRVPKTQTEPVSDARADDAPDARFVTNALVTTNIKIVDSTGQLPELTNAIVSSRQRACPQGFFFITKPEEISGLTIGRIYNSCQTTNGISANYDLVFPRGNGGYYVINATAEGNFYIVAAFKLLRAYEPNLRLSVLSAIQNMSKAQQ